jgi:maleylacetate reductase
MPLGWGTYAHAHCHNRNGPRFFHDRKRDGIVSPGGGSAIGLGKAIAFRTDCPQICIPTSFAGSETTNILGETVDGGKITRRNAKIQPETVIYDPSLLASLPDAFAVTSGLNAIAHAVEGLYAFDGNPIVALMAEEGIGALSQALIKGNVARREALYGAWLCGSVLGSVSMALHHKLCHVLVGTFNLPMRKLMRSFCPMPRPTCSLITRSHGTHCPRSGSGVSTSRPL